MRARRSFRSSLRSLARAADGAINTNERDHGEPRDSGPHFGFLTFQLRAFSFQRVSVRTDGRELPIAAYCSEAAKAPNDRGMRRSNAASSSAPSPRSRSRFAIATPPASWSSRPTAMALAA